MTTDIFSDIPSISANPGLASDVLHLLVAASMGRMLPPGTINTYMTRWSGSTAQTLSVRVLLRRFWLIRTNQGPWGR